MWLDRFLLSFQFSQYERFRKHAFWHITTKWRRVRWRRLTRTKPDTQNRGVAHGDPGTKIKCAGELARRYRSALARAAHRVAPSLAMISAPSSPRSEALPAITQVATVEAPVWRDRTGLAADITLPGWDLSWDCTASGAITAHRWR